MTDMFDMRCREYGIEHRLTKIKHHWTNSRFNPQHQNLRPNTKGVVILA